MVMTTLLRSRSRERTGFGSIERPIDLSIPLSLVLFLVARIFDESAPLPPPSPVDGFISPVDDDEPV